jgi:hypothetical protein
LAGDLNRHEPKQPAGRIIRNRPGRPANFPSLDRPTDGSIEKVIFEPKI